LYAYSQVVSPASPYSALYRYLKNRDLTPQNPVPKFMFNVLNGGKALGSKVKFSRFYLILDVSPEDTEVDAMEIFLKIQAQLKKQIQAHKLGENGFKGGSPDGSYFNALENNNESFKFIEDAIAAVQVNVRFY
jgi:enolase